MKYTIQGHEPFFIHVFKAGNPVMMDEHGRLEKKLQTGELSVRVKLPKENKSEQLSLAVVNNRTVQAIHPDSRDNNFEVYNCPIVMNTTRGGTAYTQYPSNCRRVVAVRPDGRVNIWQLSLFGQHGRFKLSFKHAYQIHAYEDNDEIGFVGDYVSWKNFSEFVERYFADLPKSPNQISKEYGHIGKSDLDLPPEPDRGVVKFFNDARGVGVIATMRGDLKVHWRDVRKREDDFQWLQHGDTVKIKKIGSPQGNSSLKHQAYGVKVVESAEPIAA